MFFCNIFTSEVRHQAGSHIILLVVVFCWHRGASFPSYKMAAASMSLKIPSQATPASKYSNHRSRGRGNSLAHLVSKFEILNSAAPKEQAARPPSGSTSSSHMPSSNTASSQNNRSRESTGRGTSSAISPSQQTLQEHQPASIQTASTTTSESQSTRNSKFYLCSRHKSVAERRKIFETDDESMS